MTATVMSPRGRIDLLDHGFVRLVDSMGNDLSVVRAARVSLRGSVARRRRSGQDKRLIGYLWNASTYLAVRGGDVHV